MSQRASRLHIFRLFLLHLHPRTVPVSTLRFTLSFGLGGMAVTLVCVMFVTGLLQLLSYSPQPMSAYASIQHLYTPGEVGGFIRNLHFWAGNLLVVVTFFHCLRVYLTGALDRKRRVNWLIGIGLFLLVLFANFTGYLLPWDQLAYWAVTIFTNMLSYIPFIGEQLALLFRGSNEVGGSTLQIFFGLHVGFLPITLLVLTVTHFWLVRKAGGLIQKDGASRERVLVSPHLTSREVAVASVLLALLCLFAAVVDAPLGGPANPGESPNPAKAAWYFMGLQELLLHLHPAVAICVVPTLLVTFLAAIPFASSNVLPGGIWLGGRRGGRLALTVLLVASCITFLAVIIDEQILHGQNIPEIGGLLTQRGFLPLTIVVLLELVLYFAVIKVFHFSKAQAMMAVFLANVSVILTLTATGIWFRGGGMALIPPF